MKRLILSAACALSLASCGGPPAGPNQKLGNESPQTEVNLPAPTIKVFVENSGSMDGYVKGATDFENAVYSYLSDIQHADLGVRTDSLAAKNTLILNYINSEVLQQKPDVREFIEALEPADFKMKGGKEALLICLISLILSYHKQTIMKSLFLFRIVFSHLEKIQG